MDEILLEERELDARLRAWLATAPEGAFAVSLERLGDGRVLLRPLPEATPELLARLRVTMARYREAPHEPDVTRYLTAAELLVIHQALLETFGGMAGITEAGFARLEAAAATPRQSAFGAELYAGVAAKAGALAHAIVRGHPFTDGNKRVAVAALDLFVSLNGGRLTADNDAIYSLAMAAANRMSRAELIGWVEAHLAPGESMATAQHLTLGDIVDIRDRFAAADPERFEIVNTPGLLSALTTPFQAAFGQEAFPELADKAAALAFLLIANHPFRDGNKRIAGEAMRLFLARNGLALGAGPEAVRAFTRLITTTHDPRDPRLLAWLAKHTRPAPPSAPASL